MADKQLAEEIEFDLKMLEEEQKKAAAAKAAVVSTPQVTTPHAQMVCMLVHCHSHKLCGNDKPLFYFLQQLTCRPSHLPLSLSLSFSLLSFSLALSLVSVELFNSSRTDLSIVVSKGAWESCCFHNCNSHTSQTQNSFQSRST